MVWYGMVRDGRGFAVFFYEEILLMTAMYSKSAAAVNIMNSRSRVSDRDQASWSLQEPQCCSTRLSHRQPPSVTDLAPTPAKGEAEAPQATACC